MKTLAFAIMTATYFYSVHRMDCENKLLGDHAPIAYSVALVMFVGTCLIGAFE